MATQTIQVALKPVMTSGSFGYWTMSVNGGASQGPGSYPPLQVNNGNKADFTFTIQNGPGQNYTFASLLVPSENGVIHNAQGFGTPTLTFKDRNSNKGDLPYEILFNGAPKLDPIIKNEGGGPPLAQNYLLPVAGLLLGVILTLIAVKLFRKG